MTLCLRAIDLHHQWRDFVCQVDELETAFDLLARLVASGSTLINAHIIDGDALLRLSVDAFDGEPLAGPVRQLQHEWEEILARPVRPLSQRNAEPMKRMEHLQRVKAEQLHQTITSLQRLIERAREMRSGHHRDRLITRYRSIIAQYQRALARTEANRAMLI